MTPVADDIVKPVLQQLMPSLLLSAKALGFNVRPSNTLNEATRLVCASQIICAAVAGCCHATEPSILIRREESLSSAYAEGRADYLANLCSDPEIFDVSILVMEGKSLDMIQGTAQVIMSLDAMDRQNRSSRFSDIDHLYGLVTTLKHWRLIKYTPSIRPGYPTELAQCDLPSLNLRNLNEATVGPVLASVMSVVQAANTTLRKAIHSAHSHARKRAQQQCDVEFQGDPVL